MTHFGDDDMNDDISNLFDRSHLPKQAGELPSIKDSYRPVEQQIVRRAERAEQDIHYDVCKACKGSGRFISYTGRDVGQCFKCKGKGRFGFKTDAATRQHQTELRQARKAKAEDAYREEFKAELTWLGLAGKRQVERQARGEKVWQFPIDLCDSFAKYGTLTDNQIAAIRKCMARDEERLVARQEAAQARADAAPTVDASPILAAFQRARENVITNEPVEGDLGVIITKNPTLRLAAGDPVRGFTFSPARKDPAIVYVREGEQYLGKITGGKFFRVRECDDASERLVLECAAQPAMAAKAYGLHYQCCGVCGRTLTNRESRERGIGPYCAARYGF